MKKIQPLSKYPIVKTECIEKAETEITNSIADASIQNIDERNRFEMSMNSVKIGCTSLMFNRFKTGATINARLKGNFIHFSMGFKNQVKYHFGKESVIVNPQNATIIQRDKEMEISRSDDSETIMLRVSVPKLMAHFEKLTDQYHRDSIIFNHNVDLTNGSGAELKRVINFIVNELNYTELESKNYISLRSYDHMLMNSLLSLDHSYSEKLLKNHQKQVAPRRVRHAEEYMRSNLNETITIIDLLRICKCSRNALFSTFRNVRGYSPMEFLTEQRLQKARTELLKHNPKHSVSSIALDHGFRHLGRFSQIYRKRFGECPSVTFKS